MSELMGYSFSVMRWKYIVFKMYIRKTHRLNKLNICPKDLGKQPLNEHKKIVKEYNKKNQLNKTYNWVVQKIQRLEYWTY